MIHHIIECFAQRMPMDAREKEPVLCAAVAIGRDPAILERIMDETVHLAIWQRPAPEYGAAVSELDWDAIDDIDDEMDVVNVPRALPISLANAGYLADLGLADELAALAVRFAKIVACDRLRVRLDVIRTDACRKFHADNVTVRLLMPLVGPGTQWLAARGVDADPPVADGQLQIGEVGLFKGRVWAERPEILHRSPPVAATGITRLLLAIDPLGDVHDQR